MKRKDRNMQDQDQDQTATAVLDQPEQSAQDAPVWMTVKQVVAYSQLPANTVRNAFKLRAEFANKNATGDPVSLEALDNDPAQVEALTEYNARYRPDDSVDYKIVEVKKDAVDRWLAARQTSPAARTATGERKFIIRLNTEQVEAFKAGTLDTKTIELEAASKPKSQSASADSASAGDTSEVPEGYDPSAAPVDGSDTDGAIDAPIFGDDPNAPQTNGFNFDGDGA